jgi:hypothetical protein
LAHKKFDRKKVMPQNKNLTQICLSEGGFGKHHGVTTEHERGVDRGAGSPIPKSGKKREIQNVG